MGLNGCFVIIGLIDCCYIMFIMVLMYRFGGVSSGFAGIGKTEIIKDLVKFMVLFCVVFNCGEGLDYKVMGVIFSGFV